MTDKDELSANGWKQFEAFLKRVLLEVRDGLKRNEKNLPTDRHYFISYPKGVHYMTYDHREDVEWVHAVHEALEQLPLPSLPATLQMVKANPALKGSILIDGAGDTPKDEASLLYYFNHFLLLFISFYFQKANGFVFKPSIFRQAMAIAKARVARELPRGVVVCPLINVKLQVREIDLGDGIKIRKVREEELEGWLNNDGVRHDWSDLHDIQCVVEVPFEKPSTKTGSFPFEEKEKVLEVITPIQLVMGPKVRTIFLEERVQNEFDLRHWVVEWISGTTYVGEMKIDAHSKKQIINMRKQTIAKKDVRPLHLALRRWDYSRDRGNQEDPILDFWIGLEALFNVQGGGGSIRHSTSMRAACFLGKNAKQRSYIFKMLQDSYDLRSAVAHGRKVDPRKKENITIFNETGRCMQTAIYNFLLDPKIKTTADFQAVVAKIDIDLRNL